MSTVNATKILLVDDYPDNLVALHALLKREDVEFIDARSGSEALEALLVHEVALGLIDVQMPEMDGFELAQIMRSTERTRRIPIVFLTATARAEQRIFEGYSVGAVDFLSKPVDPEILKSKVDVFVQLHRHKQQLAEQIEIQKEMLRVNELLTAAISHDLRNPLSAIIGAAEIIRNTSKDQTISWAAEKTRSAGARMAHLLDELLDFSEIRLNRKLRLRAASFDLGEIARRVVTEHRLADSSAEINLSADGDLSVFWDESRIERMLSNLIANALKHGNRSEAVVTQLDGTNDTAITLSIANKGQIPPAILPIIFSPFKTTEARRTRNSGLGLGLYIVDQVVKLHSGTIQVESSEEAGTRFTLRIPRVPDNSKYITAIH